MAVLDSSCRCGAPRSTTSVVPIISCSSEAKRSSNFTVPQRTPPYLLSVSAGPGFSNLLRAATFAATLPNCTYPDPIPDFADSETKKFKAELVKKLTVDMDEFGDDLFGVVDACTEIFSKFLHEEYGGPGTLLVEPFTDMFIVLKEKQLPGAPLAARAALLWAQSHVDQDWEVWNYKSQPKQL